VTKKAKIGSACARKDQARKTDPEWVCAAPGARVGLPLGRKDSGKSSGEVASLEKKDLAMVVDLIKHSSVRGNNRDC